MTLGIILKLFLTFSGKKVRKIDLSDVSSETEISKIQEECEIKTATKVELDKLPKKFGFVLWLLIFQRTIPGCFWKQFDEAWWKS